MESLLAIRSNIFYTKEDDNFIKNHEIILLVDKAKYTQTNGGQIVRERAVDELRFSISNESIDTMINHLEALKTIEEKDLK